MKRILQRSSQPILCIRVRFRVMSGHNLYTFGLAADAGRSRIFFSSRFLSFLTGAGGCKSYRIISDSKWGCPGCGLAAIEGLGFIPYS